LTLSDSGLIDAALDQRRGETVDYVVRRLREGILHGRFAPGQRLIARDVMEHIGISRGPVREAFRRLAAEGLIDVVPNRGAVVRRMSRRQVSNLFQIRECLEGLAARLAALHIDEVDNRAQFTEVWAKVRPRGEAMAWNTFIEHNRLYHMTIVRIGGNEQLCELIDNLQLPMMMLQVGLAMRPEHTEISHTAHVAIAEAILDGDAQAAEAAMQEHMRSSREWVLELPADAFKQE
jgi:DNA-binding GntR family transcriptional regulator